MNTDRLVLIDPNMARRAELTRLVLELGVHVEQFENAMEFAQSGIETAIVLCADEGRAMSTLANARTIALHPYSLIAYRENPDTRDVVNAMRMGADDYLAWPIQGQSLEYRIKSIARAAEVPATSGGTDPADVAMKRETKHASDLARTVMEPDFDRKTQQLRRA